ncbi:MAG: class I SAM-dependent methyltransferase [Bacteroidales bacterium]|nr:class I SAM-dependent methyltransferase [Bacteroidales bacterium]
MISQFIYALKFIQYKLTSKHKKGHGIHSPFMFFLITKVLRKNIINDDLKAVLNAHKKIKKSKQKINYKEIGAGSKYKQQTSQKVSSIVRRSSITPKYGKLIYNLTCYFNPKNILELGSSVGISSMYISQADRKANFISIDGVYEKQQIAEKKSKELNQSTKFICGDFDEILETTLTKFDQLDLVFFDGNHKKESTINYFNSCLNKIHNNTVFIFDDIHWSSEMEGAWDYIKNHKKVKVSVDLFRMGLIFFKQELSYEQFVIKF